jgi:hypothetical protein
MTSEFSSRKQNPELDVSCICGGGIPGPRLGPFAHDVQTWKIGLEHRPAEQMAQQAMQHLLGDLTI